MATQIVRTCDLCTDQPRAGEAISIQLGRQPLRSVDLCGDHYLQWVDPLEALLREHGVKVDRPASPTGKVRPAPAQGHVGARKGQAPRSGERPLVCLWCGTRYAATTGLQLHLVRLHGFPAGTTLAMVYGDQCPLCDQRIDQLGGHHGHLRTHHPGIHGLAQLHQAALAEGDPFGVVAQVYAKVPKAKAQATLAEVAQLLAA